MKFLYLCFLTSFFSFNALGQKSENEIFDAHRMDPEKFLLEQYELNQILFIGSSNHNYSTPFQHLNQLLAKVGNDPRLKYIILERSYDISDFYEKLSVDDLEETLRNYSFPSIEAQTRSFCEPEWAYTITNFFPHLRMINKNRPSQNPIVVKSIDSMHSTFSFDWPGPDRPVVAGNCKPAATSLFVVSASREVETAKNFISNVLDKLESTDKAIVIYHQGHLYQGFEACQNFMNTPNEWVSNYAPLNWLSFVVEANPSVKAKTSLILLDGKAGAYHRNGVLKLTERQSRRYENEVFAIDLNPFSKITSERGIDMFMADSNFMQFYMYVFDKQLKGDGSISDLATGVIWDTNIEPSVYKEAYEYLPDYCSVDGDQYKVKYKF